MGKRKTLQQKKLIDIKRHSASHQEASLSPSSTNTHSYSFTSITKHTAPEVHATVVTDVRKTALISIAIIAIELLLFSLLQNHVLALPFVRY